MCYNSFYLLIIFALLALDIPIPVSLYGVLICLVLHVIIALVVATVAHPVQLLIVLVTMSTLCSKWYIVVANFFHMYIGEQYFYTRYTTTLSTCSGLLG